MTYSDLMACFTIIDIKRYQHKALVVTNPIGLPYIFLIHLYHTSGGGNPLSKWVERRYGRLRAP